MTKGMELLNSVREVLRHITKKKYLRVWRRRVVHHGVY